MARMPDFIVIGSAKCGTTSLCDDIARGRSFFVSRPKEPEFFCRDENYAKGLGWYASLFDGCGEGRLAGEGSTMYSSCGQFPESAARIARDLPDVRLVYMVREPVQRAYSHWIQERKTNSNLGLGLDIPSVFEEAIARKSHYVSCGDYRMQLERYLEFFPRERIHVMVFEDYVADRAASLRSLCGFLGADASDLVGMEPVWSNKSDRHYYLRSTQRLADTLGRVPGAGFIKRSVPRDARRRVLEGVMGSRLGGRLVRRSKPAPMKESTRADLAAGYRPMVEWLESYLGRPLDCWRRDHSSGHQSRGSA
jgi:hypothetical protein